MLAVGSSASAQDFRALNVPAAVRSIDVDSAAKPLSAAVQAIAQTVARPAVAATTAVATATGTILQTQPAQAVTVKLAPAFATEAAWLYKNG